ncbi:hypothetical protein NCCP1664_21660 [Zafaria cholistanensis]|uniref:Uncharacterized protein n=1 Tax=Zafaria cholistanensis TaxID=1682741 RepID=A0A5A7NUV8_9MICC|nr:hypothetical protein [Zafaria cholistanensis]GER23671.1 hypothetical protein NCCP1664_21660 [Zafaria cholistanensis]
MTTYAAILSAAAGAASGPTPGVLVGVGLVVLVFLGWVYRLLTAHGRAARRSRPDGNGPGPRGGDVPDNGSGPGSGPRP